MPVHRLAPGVSFALVAGVATFLDLRRDRYFRLDPDLAAAFDLLREGGDDALHPATLDRLEATGLFVRGRGGARIEPARATAPERSALDREAPGGAFPLTTAAEALWLLRGGRRRLARDGLHEVIERRRASARPVPQCAERCADAARRFVRARRLVPTAPNCLADSLALDRYLTRRSMACELIFGVKLDPFAAHCWMQSGGVVLNDSVDTIAAFEPILTV